VKNGMYEQDGGKIWYLSDTLHRMNGPAIQWQDGATEWYAMGMRHRENGPAIELTDGGKEWYLMDRKHREDGPAIERTNGSKEWWINGTLHREDGPAIEDADGHKEWWVNGKHHREDGPAIEEASGIKFYFLEGERLLEADFHLAMQKKNAAAQAKVEELTKSMASLNSNQFSEVMKIADRMKSIRTIRTPPPIELVKVQDTHGVTSPDQVQDLKTDAGFLDGLRKDLRESSKDSMSMTLAYGIKDMVTKGAGLKKNKFLKLGATAGLVAVVAASPVGIGIATGTVVIGSIMTIAAAIHTSVVAANYTGEFLVKKVKDSFNNPVTEHTTSDTHQSTTVTPKNQSQVMASIGKLRSDLMNSEKSLKNGLGHTANSIK